MSETTTPTLRSFHCTACRGEIQIPHHLPPTTAPCPHCGTTLTSPPPEAAPSPAPPGWGEVPVKLTPEPDQRSVSALPPQVAATAPGAAHAPPSAPRSGMPPIQARADGEGSPESAGRKGPSVDRLVNIPRSRGQGVDSQNIPDPTLPAMAEAEAADGAPGGRRRGIHPAIPFLVAILLIVGVLVGLIVMKRKSPDPGPLVVPDKPAAPAKELAKETPDAERMEFLRTGWKEASSSTLTGFLHATTVEEKARHVIGGEARIPQMEEFYGATEAIDESDTPIELFSHFDLDIADKKRGLFMMQYDRPSQFDMREFFRPVATLEVENELEPPGQLLTAFASRKNFAMEPMRVMAFFKEIDGKLLLDWDVYSQTKYRTLRNFMTHPRPGHREVFRVMAREELPASTGIDVTKERYFRFSDPAHVQDYVQVPVAAGSKPGRVLADLAWINIPGKQAQDRYATVELGWTEAAEPQLALLEVVCWEFLGLGGVVGNADPVDDAPGLDPVNLENLGPDPLAPAPPNPALEPVSVPGTPLSEDGPHLPGEDPRDGEAPDSSSGATETQEAP